MNFYLYSSVAFVLGLAIAKPIIAALIKLKSTQSFREQGLKSHIETKSGTPTMGAWIFLLPIFITGIIIYINDPSTQLLLSYAALLVGTALGAIDDILKVLGSNYKGLESKQKLLVQFLTSVAIAYFAGRYLFSVMEYGLPQWLSMPIGLLWAFVVIAGTSNAINLTDGVDGLATTQSILAFAGLGTMLLYQHDYSLALLCFTTIAALAAFLCFNLYPAKVFMGDTGSLGLGMLLGAIAYIAKLEWYLLIFALVPVVETLSVVAQVASAKLSRKFLGKDIRPLKMAPLHHHLELCGWSETKIVLILFVIQITITGLFCGIKLL
ncbi:MAG: phospho-N-acetylmuramoyl-pentapeptide-transferase [Candidatus Melainabacteria bacterium]|nr:phospho-N-acetylmuramoyl-pentapeptide-transferase [Candidatus Melainabacteria bacterium]